MAVLGIENSVMDAAKDAPERAIRVLVIDDNPPHAEGLAELLQISGFEASYVLTGGEGVETARRLQVDAVLLDMNLPDMNGFEVCRKLRRDPRTAYIAIIFHSAQGSAPGARHEGDAYLTYPVAMHQVYSVIRTCVERRREWLRSQV
jgi:DNA-binding response OmpR family regulator